MRIVIVGATSEIAKQCCIIWCQSGKHDFVLSARNAEKLAQASSELRRSFPGVNIEEHVFDHLNVEAIEAFVSTVSRIPVDQVLIAHGSLTNQENASRNLTYLWREIETNAISPIVFSELWSQVLTKQNRGNLAVIGSVAGDRGRKINHGYGSAKSALETYVSGIQHRLANTKVGICFVKPGPTLTPMTEGVHTGPITMTDPKKVARALVKSINQRKRVAYIPGRWAIIMFIVRSLPFFVFKRMRF